MPAARGVSGETKEKEPVSRLQAELGWETGPLRLGRAWESVSQNLPRCSNSQIELFLFSPRIPSSALGDFSQAFPTVKRTIANVLVRFQMRHVVDCSAGQPAGEKAVGQDSERMEDLGGRVWGGGLGSALQETTGLPNRRKGLQGHPGFDTMSWGLS